jgi:transposase
MSLVTSPDALLRLMCTQPEEQIPTPRVLGVDDFSFCTRKTYGTILVDLERRIPIDLLPDREAAPFVEWLKDHAGVEIISRDRGGPYAEGARRGAPEARACCRPVASVIQPFGNPERRLPQQASTARCPGTKACRTPF